MNKLLTVVLILFFWVSSLPFGESWKGASFAQDGLQKEYYTNGKIKSEINFYSGVREGEAKFYYENGNLKEELFFVNGRIEGLVRYYNKDGKLIEMANLENGKREGPTSIFDSTGKYITDIYYERGKKVVESHPYYEKIVKPKVVAEQTKTEKTEEPEKIILPAKNTKKSPDEMLPPEIEELLEKPSTEFLENVEVMPEPVGGPDQIQRKASTSPVIPHAG